MAKRTRKPTQREARDAALRKKHEERKARIEKSLYWYLKREIEKTWKDYAIIAGGVFLGILLLILWITCTDWAVGSTYKNLIK
jgi:hypothetical protein